MKIDKNIPMPTPSRGTKYPFKTMSVGDSVFYDNEITGSQSSPAVSAHTYGRKNGKKFSARNEGDGVRIWRVL